MAQDVTRSSGCGEAHFPPHPPVSTIDCITLDLVPALCSDVMCEVVSGLSPTSCSAVRLKEEEMNSSQQPAVPAKCITCVIRGEPKKLKEVKL